METKQKETGTKSLSFCHEQGSHSVFSVEKMKYKVPVFVRDLHAAYSWVPLLRIVLRVARWRCALSHTLEGL